MRSIPILRAGFVLSILATLGWAVLMTSDDWLTSSTAMLALDGASYAAQAALWIGCLELASRLHGRAAFGAKLASAGFGLALVLDILRGSVRVWWLFATPPDRSVYLVLGYMSLGLSLVTIAGFIVAAWDQRRAAITGGAVALLAIVAVDLAPRVLSPSSRLLEYSAPATWIVRVLALLWLAHRARPSEPVPSIAQTVRGLRWIARSLWWRLAAAIGFALLSLVAIGGDAIEVFRIAMVVQVVLELLLLGAFGFGALAVARAALPGSPRRTFIVGGLAAFWCAGVMIVKVSYTYALVHDASSLGDGMRFIDGLSIGEPLIAVAAIALVALALRGIPALAALAELVSSRTIAFACLMLASIGLASFGVERATSSGNAIGMLLLGAGASLVAMALVAGLFGRAADALELEQPNLPTATIV